MFGGSATDGLVRDEFIGNYFHRGPGGFVGKQVLGFIEQLVHQLRCLAEVAGAGHGKFLDDLKVLGGTLDIVASGFSSLGSHPCKENEDFRFKLILNLLHAALFKGARSETILRRDDADLLNGPPHEECHHRVSRFVVGGQDSIIGHCLAHR